MEEGKGGADGALEMESSFVPAEELRRLVQKESDRVQRVADWLDSAKQRLAEGMPEEAEALLAKVIDGQPSHKKTRATLGRASQEKTKRQPRPQLTQELKAAPSRV